MQRLKSLTLKQLRALESVAEYGSITAAAESVSLTPPAVHSALKTLEENFQIKLLKKAPSGAFEPTPEGEILIAAHRRAQTALNRAIHEIEALGRGVAGTVSLGVVSTGKYFAPGIVGFVQDAFPDIEIRLTIGNRDEIIRRLEDETLDLAIMGRPPRAPSNLAYRLGSHPHVMIAAPDHPIATAALVTPEDVLREKIILREPGSGSRILAMRFLDRIGAGETYESTNMGSNETIKQSVRAGLGIALLSAHTCIDELRDGRLALIDMPGLPILRSWYVLHRDTLDLSGAMKNVLGMIRDNASGMIRAREVASAIGLKGEAG